MHVGKDLLFEPLPFGFYLIGPVWLHSAVTWFEIVGFSDIGFVATVHSCKELNSNDNLKLFPALRGKVFDGHWNNDCIFQGHLNL